ncbi:MAG: Fic family protein [Deltaproteobacteria bacterium]|nr:Fic family protein [Deltaproteobacteria bacterium]
MTRRTDLRRNSRPVGPELFASPEEKAILEARNGLIQFDEVRRLIGEFITEKSFRSFRLRPSTIIELQRLAIRDIFTCAGTLRQEPVVIKGTTHEPPPSEQVPALLEEMCDYVTDHWDEKSAIHLAAYLMWRINWIHPFRGGNGRTARAVSYLIMCVRLDCDFGGENTVADQIVDTRDPYYAALDAADAAWEKGKVDVSVMEELLDRLLARQLLSTHEAARYSEDDQVSDGEFGSGSQTDTDAQADEAANSIERRGSRFTTGGRITAIIAAAAVVIAAIIGAIVSLQPPKCTPNDTKECHRQCPQGAYSTQICNPDGTWTLCKCVPDSDKPSVSEP